MVIGVLGILFSGILLWDPTFAGLSLVFWTAMALVISGVYGIYMSVKLKNIQNIANNISVDLEKH